MGDRFEMTLKCAYCGKENNVWYAPTCNVYDFVCRGGCEKTNFICSDFSVKKVEDIVEQNVIDGFEMASNTYHKPSVIKSQAKQYIRDLKKRIKEDTSK